MVFAFIKQPMRLLVVGCALTSTTVAFLQCEDFGECEIATAASGRRFKQLKQSNSTISRARRSLYPKRNDIDTVIAVDTDHIQETTFGGLEGGPAPQPEVFDRLFSRAHEACFSGTCRPSTEIREGDYRIQMDGQYPEWARNGYIDLIRDAFFEAATDETWTQNVPAPPPGHCPGCPPTQRQAQYRRISGPDFFNVQRRDPNSPGSDWMRAELFFDPVGVGCGDAINAINAWGSNIPKFAPVFGVISATCASIGAA